MKIIHAADLHLGSRFHEIGDAEKAKELSGALNNSFKRLVDYARDNAIKAILLAGDVFDKDRVLKRDKDYFYSIIRGNPDISFYYLKGNHDLGSQYDEDLPNLHLFPSDGGPVSYDLAEEKVRISGFEINGDNRFLYDAPAFSGDRFNILMLHGDANNKKGKDGIDLDRLLAKNVDYLALGHIHQRSVVSYPSGLVYAYPGCLMGRGFDETEEKGFYVLDTDAEPISPAFVPLPNRLFRRIDLPCGEIADAYGLTAAAERFTPPDPDLILELVLRGRYAFEFDINTLKDALKGRYYYLKIKNEAKKALPSISYDPNSLRGIYIEAVRSDPSLSEEEKEDLISYGLSKIEKEEA